MVNGFTASRTPVFTASKSWESQTTTLAPNGSKASSPPVFSMIDADRFMRIRRLIPPGHEVWASHAVAVRHRRLEVANKRPDPRHTVVDLAGEALAPEPGNPILPGRAGDLERVFAAWRNSPTASSHRDPETAALSRARGAAAPSVRHRSGPQGCRGAAGEPVEVEAGDVFHHPAAVLQNPALAIDEVHAKETIARAR